MGESDKKGVIVISDQELQPQKGSFWKKVKQAFTGDEVKINILSVNDDSDNIFNLIRLIDEAAANLSTDGISIEEANRTTDQFGEPVAMQILVSAENNRSAANDFCQRVRQNIDNILPSHHQVAEASDMNYVDLWNLANRWGIPLKIVRLGDPATGGHYTLGLKDPEQLPNGGNRILVYDPLSDLPRYVNFDGTGNGVQVYDNELVGIETPYDLSLEGDEEIAQNYDLVEAKTGRIQFDGYNCGLMCIFMAAIRKGVEPGYNTFKEIGRDLLEKDTRIFDSDFNELPGIKVLKREEISGLS